MANIKNATLKLWIYTGTIGNKPEEPNYVLYKEVKTGSTVITFEIAELVKDYIDINFEGIYGEITQTAWVEWELTKVFDDDSVVTETNQVVASSGYGYFEDKINPVEVLERGALISNEIIYTVKGQVVPFISQLDASLTTITADNTVYTSDNDGKALPDVTNTYIPFLTTEYGAFKAEFYNGNTLIYTEYFGKSVTDITADTTIYTADSTLLTADTTTIAGGESKIIEYVNIPKDTTRIVVTTSRNEIEVKEVVALDECKYKPYKVSFINKFGAVQDLWFFKARKESVNISKDIYTENTLEESTSGVFYKTSRASRLPHKFNVQKSITLNTGFINEEYNEVIQQLLLTERAWVHEDDTVFPIIPKTQNLDYKSSLNDGLINYTIEFDYAYNEINLIK